MVDGRRDAITITLVFFLPSTPTTQVIFQSPYDAKLLGAPRSMMQPHPHQHETNDDRNRDQLAHERCVMFLDFGLHKWSRCVVNLGHCRLLPAAQIAQRALGVLLFRANGLSVLAKLGDGSCALRPWTLALLTLADAPLSIQTNRQSSPVATEGATNDKSLVGSFKARLWTRYTGRWIIVHSSSSATIAVTIQTLVQIS